jgi:anti-sigma regulatory factor (Ser/Thr protein kinase)
MQTEAPAAESPFRHEALLYGNDGEYLEGTVPFVEAGLAAGEPVLVAVPQERLELLRGALPVEHPLLQLADMEAMGRNPARIIPAWADFARPLLSCGRTARGIGEPVWAGRSPDELTECAWHESLINMAFADADGFTLLCPYDTHGLEAEVIDEAHRTHPRVGPPEGIEDSPCFRADVRTCPDEALPPVPDGAEWVAFDHREHPALRRHVGAIATAAGLPGPSVEDVVVAVNEAVVNAVRHGGGSGRLCTWTRGSSFLCEIRDRGYITDPLAGRRRPTLAQVGGRGLWLMTQLCDLVQIRRVEQGQALRLHISDPA